MEERATKLEKRAAQQRLEATLLEERVAALQERVDQAAFRAAVTDELEELGGYCLMLGLDFKRLCYF